MKTLITPSQLAARFGGTPEQTRALYLRNAASLQTMAEKAERTGRTVNGYDAHQLWSMVARARGNALSVRIA